MKTIRIAKNFTISLGRKYKGILYEVIMVNYYRNKIGLRKIKWM